MNDTAHDQHSRRREPGLRDASAHDLFMDFCRIGPAPTRSRELFVLVVTVVLIALVLSVITPPLGAALVAVGIVAVIMALRWVAGSRNRWTTR